MNQGDTYIVQTKSGICTMKIIAETSKCVKVYFGNGCTEWVYKDDFKSQHSYVDPKKKILEKLNG